MNRSWVNSKRSRFEDQAASCELRVASILLLIFMKDFKKLLIWQKAMEVVAASYLMANLLPSEEKYGLRSQITRCAVSIAANIAEGSSRTSQKEYKHYCEIALGSCFELETHCLITIKLGLANEGQLTSVLAMVDEEQKMLMAFIKSLNV
jgi:four helix bundle protein